MASLFEPARLGVNIDHIATVRQLRGTPYPNLVEAALITERAGAQQITVHLREDRRHIQDADVVALKKALSIPLNLEMACTPTMVKFAARVRPEWACLVPEKRQEVTTEGGLDLKKGKKRASDTIKGLKRAKIKVSLFIEPSLESVKLAQALGADAVEFHTGQYCLATQRKGGARTAAAERKRLEDAARLAVRLGLHAHAGHGFDYENVRTIAALERDPTANSAAHRQVLIEEFNIGHAIVARSIFVGLTQAVQEMITAISAP
jgi:pyridoxine 5-phosphate synthase